MDIKLSREVKIDRNTLFIIGFLLFFIQFWSKGFLGVNENLLHIPAVLFIIASIDFKKLTKEDVLFIVILYMLGVASYVFSHSLNILKIGIILSAAKNKDIDKVIKYTFWCSLVIMIIHIIGSTVFGIGTVYKDAYFGRAEIERRYFFGFPHANTVQSLFNVILILWVYTYFIKIKEKKVQNISLAIITILMFAMYVLTRSRTGLIISLCTIILPIILNPQKHKIITNYKFINSMYVLLIFVIVFFVYFLSDTFLYNKLDSFMTGRLKFSTLYTERYGITLYGQETSDVFYTEDGKEVNIVFDQGIINPLISYGIVINIFFYVIQLKLIKKYCIENNYKRVMVMIVMILYAITENVLFYPFSNISILFMADYIYGKLATKTKRISLKSEAKIGEG